MSADTNYEDILDRGWDEIPEVIVLPEGSYRMKGMNASYKPPRDADGKPVVIFVDKPVEAMDDLEEELPEDYDLENNKVFTKFFIDGPADWDRVRNHLKLRGITHFHTRAEGGIKKTLEGYRGTEAMAYLKKNVFTRNDGSVGEDNVASSWAPVD